MCAPAITFATTAQTGLVWQLVCDYLAGKGYRLEDLQQLSAEIKHDLMTAACTYASLKMAEIESRSRFIQTIRIKV